jgi:hypothetical protein
MPKYRNAESTEMPQKTQRNAYIRFMDLNVFCAFCALSVFSVFLSSVFLSPAFLF